MRRVVVVRNLFYHTPHCKEWGVSLSTSLGDDTKANPYLLMTVWGAGKPNASLAN